ncbi:phage tail protein [Sporosarcina sp. P13]|uniref:phage tail family protein n=1 Tax=Sporosarcina sp. P13 TaxID=2048263 RepID=UPI000C1655EE|nr:phage tail family protein [Sporosarcina sp. P13]PIC65331.1 phage tail protein [Sporosarcina sp. P13]
MFKLIFTNSRNESIELFGSPFRLSSVEGLGDVGADLQSQRAPYQDGDTLLDVILEPRFMSLELTVRGKEVKAVETNRRRLASVFNPKLGLGLLKYIRGDEVKMINVVAESVASFPDGDTNRGTQFQKALLFLKAPSPYWLSIEKVEQLVVWEGGLTFPLKLPTRFARQSESKSKTLLNKGDVETPLRIVFNGPATAPIRIENKTTDDFIQVNQPLAIGERLEINTAFGQKRVERVLADGTRFNAFHYIKRGSKFFNLIPGNNLLDYSTGEDYERAGVLITWQNRYLSV